MVSRYSHNTFILLSPCYIVKVQSVTLLFVLLALITGIQAGFAETTNSSPCTISDTSPLTSMNWTSEAPPDSPGTGLLLGAKALMKGIYTYSANNPDYLPTSYTNQNSQMTAYVIHANEESSVFWVPNQSTQIQWVSEPGDAPVGWSGIVTVAGPVTGNISSLHCFTDCSGFVTALFTYADTITPAKFTGWKKGSQVPEANCKDPQGSCIVPNPVNYYSFFTSGENGWFKEVTLDELSPGDLISYANTITGESGHIMLVVAVTSCPEDQNSRIVVVADETGDTHTFDTRPVKVNSQKEKTGTGLGMGLIQLSYSENNTLEFYWGLNSPKPQVGPVVLGRAL